MLFLSILQHYALWHYTDALVSYIRVTKNLWWFLVQFFSIPLLLGSLFAPFKRVTEQRRRKWDFEDLAGTLLVNLMSRLIGAFIRGLIVILGLLSLIGFSLLSIIGYAIWLVAPALVIISFLTGLWLLW